MPCAVTASSEIKLTKPAGHAIQLAVMSSSANYHFRCVRYLPNAVSGEFLNIGLLLFRQEATGASLEGARWLDDFAVLRRFDSAADIEVVRGSCDELESRLRVGAQPDQLAATLTGAIQMAAPVALHTAGLTDDQNHPAALLSNLAALYLRPAITASAAAELSRALQLLKAVPVLEGHDKDLVEQAIECALSGLQTAAGDSSPDCDDGEHCEPRILRSARK